MTTTIRLAGLTASVVIHRDPQGIPHVRAGSSSDAFFGQGWAHAEDRLFQMEYDRRRAYGRWAEWVGPAGLEADRLNRRFRIGDSARLDWERATPEARAMLTAFAAGVNAFIASTSRWGAEFEIAGAEPEPWREWDSMAVFKIRHLDMGPWTAKLWRARLLRQLGPERAAELTRAAQPHPLLIVPPGAEYRGMRADGYAEMDRHASAMFLVPGATQGSNNWALAGSRTASGKPLVAGDPHRSLDVPNVYYQNHLACPDWDAIGLSFPGVPGLPHFGHNARVAWCVTHAMADYQDLFIERFDGGDPPRYEFRGEWRETELRTETIAVRGADPVEIETAATHHGPVVIGEPRHGHAIACAYTALSGPNSTFDTFVPMLAAQQRSGARSRHARVGGAGQQPGLGRRRRPHRLSDARPGSRSARWPTRGRRCPAGRASTSGAAHPLRGDARGERPRRRLDRHRQQQDHRHRLPALPRSRLRRGLPHPPRGGAARLAGEGHRRRHGGDPRRPRVPSRAGHVWSCSRGFASPSCRARTSATRSGSRRWRGCSPGTA